MSLLEFDPPVIAHRGASYYAPENTLAAFNKAQQLGVQWIEFDVMLAHCGTLILFHDDTLERTTNGCGEIRNYPYSYLKKLNANKLFPHFPYVNIPTLEEALFFLKENNMNANIEIKALTGEEIKIAKKISEMIRIYNMTPSSILFSSFSYKTLEQLMLLLPEFLFGLCLHECENDWQKCLQSNLFSIHINQEIIDSSLARQIKSSDKKLLSYTVNEIGRAQELYRLGVDALFTDKPDKILLAWQTYT